jgi:hypothetical protein
VEQFDAVSPFLTQIPTILRILFLVWHRNELKYVLDYLENAFLTGEKIGSKLIDILTLAEPIHSQKKTRN